MDGNVVRLGVIGAGRHSTSRLLPALSRVPDAVLVAVCDLDLERCSHVARKYSVPVVTTDHREVLALDGLDGVIVCIGPDTHHRIAADAMRVGVPSFVEKPPAVTLDAAAELLAISRSTGVPCMVGFRKRYTPAYRRARDIVSSNEFSAPALFAATRTSGRFAEDETDPTTWFLLDMGVHVIDLARFLCGEVASVYACRPDRSSYAVALTFQNGAVGTLSLTSRDWWSSCDEQVRVVGEGRETVQVDGGVTVTYQRDAEQLVVYRPNFTSVGSDSLVDLGLVPELHEFVAAVRAGRRSESDIEDAFRTMELYEAILSSASRGVPCKVQSGHSK